MSELRDDLVTGRRVLLVPGRAARPHTTPAAATATATVGRDCPFCPGNEHETPPEHSRTGDGEPDTPGWRVRVVPNLYPIVGGRDAGPGAGGAHDVVVLDPDHSCDLGRMTDAGVQELFVVLRARARVHAAAGLAHVQILVNHGRAAGASIAHPHAQVLAIEFVPPAVREALERFASAETDLVADDYTASGFEGQIRDGAVRVWSPWAAASPYETRIAVSASTARFEETPDDALGAVARSIRDVVAGLERVLGQVAYNVVIHNAPTRGFEPFHWYATVVPRIATIAGFELGTGVFVNTVDPSDAAASLREALDGDDAA